MRRIFGYALLAVSVAWMPASHAGAAPRAQIIPETTAARHGLARQWFNQADVDLSRGRVTDLVLDRGTLFVQTDQAILQAIDAETGQTLWSVQVGRRGHPSLRPSTNADMVAVVNGSNLFVLNRHQGKLLWQQAIPGAPGAGPALSDMRVYVPSTDGLILAYRLKPAADPAEELGLVEGKASETADKEKGANKEKGSEAVAKELEMRRRHGLRLQQERIPPLACQSFGRALVQPLVTRQNEGEECVAWPTDRGYLFVGRINRQEENRFEMCYKLETNAEIAARPTLLPPLSADPADSAIIFIPSQDGFLHAIRETDGVALWRFSTGEAIAESAVPIGKKVFITTELGGMFCLDSQTGQQLWWAADILRFVAASKQRVYAEDRLGNLVVLHAATGGRLDLIPTPGLAIKMANLQTDRIYLASESGLLHCLREIELEKPVQHRPEPVAPQPKAKKTAQERPESRPPAGGKQAKPAPAGAPKPSAPAGGAQDPFGGAAPAGGKPTKPAPAGAPKPSAPAGGTQDPFGGAAPAGGTQDPFGGAAPAGGTQDPFGGAAPAGGAQDPFGGAAPAGGGAASSGNQK
jgi:outer membrane protein assembly factor BamB